MRNLILLGCAACLLAVSACSKPYEIPDELARLFKNEQQNSALYEAGRTHLYEGRVAKALESFRKDWVRNGDSVRTLNGIAIAYDLLGRHEIANDYFERALRVEPGSEITRRNMAMYQARQGSLAVAANAEETSLDMAPMPAVPVSVVERTSLSEWTVSAPTFENSASTRAFTKKDAAKPQPSVSEGALAAPPAAQSSVSPKMPVLGASGLRILNGTGRPDMARRIAEFCKSRGQKVNGLANARRYSHHTTTVLYAPGHADAAEEVAALFPVPVKAAQDHNLDASVEIVLGADLLEFDRDLFYGRI